MFSQRCYLNVVANANRFAELSAENVGQLHIFDAQVWSIDDYAGFAVNLPCRTNADSDDGRILRKVCSTEGRLRQFNSTFCYEILSLLSTSTFTG